LFRLIGLWVERIVVKHSASFELMPSYTLVPNNSGRLTRIELVRFVNASEFSSQICAIHIDVAGHHFGHGLPTLLRCGDEGQIFVGCQEVLQLSSFAQLDLY